MATGARHPPRVGSPHIGTTGSGFGSMGATWPIGERKDALNVFVWLTTILSCSRWPTTSSTTLTGSELLA